MHWQVGEVEADKGLAEYQKDNKMVRCPTCGHGMEKITGCNRVTCASYHPSTTFVYLLGSGNPREHFTCATGFSLVPFVLFPDDYSNRIEYVLSVESAL